MNFFNRSDYKKTWEDLATDFDAAQHYVAGHNDTKEFERSAEVTRQILNDTVKINEDDVFLEIGCGIGRVGKALAPHIKHWIGSDISSGMIKQASDYLEGTENKSLHILEDCSLKQFANESVDVVYCTVVFMHLLEWDRYKYIKESMRILKPGGRIYFDNVDITTDHGWKVFTDGFTIPSNDRPPHISMVSSADELITYGQRAGYKKTRIHKWGGAWVALTGEKPQA